MIVAGAQGGHEACSSAGEDLESGLVHPIVYKDHDGRVAGCQGSRQGVEPGFDELKVVVRANRGEGFFEIVATTKDERPHPRSLR